jgi:putative lipoprotein
MTRARLVLLAALTCGVLGALVPGVAHADDPDRWISRDKALHFDVSAGIAAVGYGVSAGWLVDARWKSLAIGGGLALVAGAGKELVDATGIFGGDPSWKDFAWDAMGALAGLALAWGVDLAVGGVNEEHPALAAPRTAVRPLSLTLHF